MTSASPSRRRICDGRWRGCSCPLIFAMIPLTGFFVFRKFYYLCTSIQERCSSGLRGTPGKRVYDKIVSRVRIPISPHQVAGRISDWLFVSGPLKACFHKEAGYKNDVRRTLATWCKGHPGEGNREKACAARLIPIIVSSAGGAGYRSVATKSLRDQSS